MSEKEKVFAYVLLDADFDGELESNLTDYYWGGIVEAFIDCEEQWLDATDLWPFGWGPPMKRASVVQIVLNHDPCHWISMLISENIIRPFFENEEDDGIVTVFKRAEINANALSKFKNENEYLERFIQLLSMTTASTCDDVIFVGGRGFSADLEIDVAEQELLREVGIQIPSRMPV